jgi:hypothetical protein
MDLAKNSEFKVYDVGLLCREGCTVTKTARMFLRAVAVGARSWQQLVVYAHAHIRVDAGLENTAAGAQVQVLAVVTVEQVLDAAGE